MKNLYKKEDYKNINIDKLPTHLCSVYVLLYPKDIFTTLFRMILKIFGLIRNKQSDGVLCYWQPFNPIEWDIMPPKGYQGVLISCEYSRKFEYNVFEQNKHPFTYFQYL
jgi:hypothetical protein